MNVSLHELVLLKMHFVQEFDTMVGKSINSMFNLYSIVH